MKVGRWGEDLRDIYIIMSGYIVTFCRPLPFSHRGRGGETTLTSLSLLERGIGGEGFYCQYSTGLDITYIPHPKLSQYVFWGLGIGDWSNYFA